MSVPNMDCALTKHCLYGPEQSMILSKLFASQASGPRKAYVLWRDDVVACELPEGNLRGIRHRQAYLAVASDNVWRAGIGNPSRRRNLALRERQFLTSFSLNDSPSRRTAFHIAPVRRPIPCSASSQAWACSVIPGSARMCAVSASSCAAESLRGARPRFGLIPGSPVSRRRIRAL